MAAAAQASRISSPVPVQETAPNGFAKFPAGVQESDTRPGRSKPRPPVEVQAAGENCASRATQPTVPEVPDFFRLHSSRRSSVTRFSGRNPRLNAEREASNPDK